MSVRIRIDQNGVDHAEHSCRGADTKRQRENGNDREPRILRQHPQSVSRIIRGVSQPPPSPNVPRDLLHQPHIPKLPPRRLLCFSLTLPSFHTLPRRHLQMAPQFLLKVCVSLLPSPETHGPPLRFLTFLPVISALGSVRPRSRPRAATTLSVLLSVVSFLPPSVDKT